MSSRERSDSSSVAGDDWLPVLEALLEGFNHSLNNRVAALGGIAQLLEMKLASRDEGGRSVATEVALLREQMGLMRHLAPPRKNPREAGRAGDALRTAAKLLFQHREARTHKYEIAEEPSELEPLLLLRADHVRVGVLVLLAASEGAKHEIRVNVKFEARAGAVRIIATTPVALDELQVTHAFRALVRFAAAEGGGCTAAAAPSETTTLILELPGLAAASVSPP